MDMSHSFWEENLNIQQVKYESCNSNDEPSRKEQYCCEGSTLNFTTVDEDCSEYTTYRKTSNVRVSRQDPMSHRIIEKRRRDRMNNCLADLSRLIPAEYLKKGRGRVEKTEIIEMAIKHMKYLQYLNHYRLGYQECMSETMRFMVEVEGHFPREPLCVRLLGHLQQHCETICRSKSDIGPQQEVPLPESKLEPNNNVYEENVVMQDNTAEKNTYKYKTDIKLRFNQDLHSAKRPKIDLSRRNSATSIENQSSTHSSPPQSDLCARVSSESELNLNRVSPTGSSVSQATHPSTVIKTNNIDIKANFSVPVFVLHAKGSFYVPLTLDYHTLLPYLGSYDLLNLASDIVLHPVAINVNFQPLKDVIGFKIRCNSNIKDWNN